LLPIWFPTLHPALDLAPTLPIVLDTGASYSRTPSALDFALEVTQAPYGFIRSAFDTSVASSSKVASTPIDPYTLITGEDTVDLLSTDTDSVDTSVDISKFASAFEVLEVREFGTATLIFISYPYLELKPTVLLEPIFDRFDWLDWVPLPRLTPTESYFHIFGRDYSQAFALFHLIPIWIYSLIRFGLE